MPQTSVTLGYEILLLLGVLVIASTMAWPRMFRHLTDAYRRRELMLVVLRETIGMIFAVVAAIGLVDQQVWATYAFAAVVLTLMVLGIALTWDLIFRAAALGA